MVWLVDSRTCAVQYGVQWRSVVQCSVLCCGRFVQCSAVQRENVDGECGSVRGVGGGGGDVWLVE
jgi:hypothetical protein